MKKAILITLCVVCLLLTGCGQKEAPDTTVNLPTSAAPAQTAQAESATAAPVLSVATQTPVSESSDAELDLTRMSSTMVYSYIFNMLSAPDDFIGQRVRIRGIYDEGVWEPTNQLYHYIIIADATACCTQGLEFILADENIAYPQPGDEFEISGIFSTYEEDGNLYIQIVADRMKKGEYQQEAQQQLNYLAQETARYPAGHAMFLLSQLNHKCPPPKMVVVPDTQTDGSQIPLRLPIDAAIALLAEPTEDYPLENEKNTFSICRGHSWLPSTAIRKRPCAHRTDKRVGVVCMFGYSLVWFTGTEQKNRGRRRNLFRIDMNPLTNHDNRIKVYLYEILILNGSVIKIDVNPSGRS